MGSHATRCRALEPARTTARRAPRAERRASSASTAMVLTDLALVRRALKAREGRIVWGQSVQLSR